MCIEFYLLMEQAGLGDISFYIRQTSWLDRDLTSVIFGKLEKFARILCYVQIRQNLVLHPSLFSLKCGINTKAQIKSSRIISNWTGSGYLNIAQVPNNIKPKWDGVD
jgi:hypothetical protein